MKLRNFATALLAALLLLATVCGCGPSEKPAGDSSRSSSEYSSGFEDESEQTEDSFPGEEQSGTVSSSTEDSPSGGEHSGAAGSSTAPDSTKPANTTANQSGAGSTSSSNSPENGSGDEKPVITSTDYAGAQAIGAYSEASETMTLGFYVSPTGSDQGDGSLQKPFKTIERAQQAIRSYLSSHKVPLGGIAVWLRAGTYQLANTLTFTSADSGDSAECPVVYTADQGEEVHLSANKMIDSSYIQKTGSDWKYWDLVPASVRDKLYQVNLLHAVDIDGNRIFTTNWDADKSSLFQGNKPVFWLYQDDVPMNLARYPDIQDNDRYAVSSWDTIADANGTSFQPANAKLDSWDASQEIYIHSPFSWMNNDFITRVSSVKSGVISLAENPGRLGIADPDGGAKPDSVRPYYAMNVVS